ncbi:metallophosphoesterase [Bryobacter aggregatus]|uniref:metallophosphoesterase n=1 Tax=Bryobacter aggregatus TaxID=360054 RepID=UPI0012BAFCC9|nr:metallophosphoesterase [Bryobacter aggregatus]
MPNSCEASIGVIDPAGSETIVRAKQTAMEGYFQYEAPLLNLKSNTKYQYRVLADGATLPVPATVGDLQFKTAGSGSFSFVHFGDSGTGDAVQSAVAKQMASEEVDFLLANGDLAYPTGNIDALEQLYFGRYAGHMARVPFFSAIGNHEYYAASGKDFLAAHSTPTAGIPPEDAGRYYSFDWGYAHIVCLDSNQISPDAAMLKWLEADLAATRRFWRIAFFHHPAFAVGAHEDEPEAIFLREHVVPLLERYGVHLVLNGHEHSYQRTHPILEASRVDPDTGGVVHITSGGGGAPCYPIPARPLIAKAASTNHYLRVDVDAATLLVRALEVRTGREIDRLRLAPAPLLTAPLVDAASYSTTVAKGGLVSIFGRNLCTAILDPSNAAPPTSLAETSVTLGTRLLSILYASSTQLNVLLPLDIEGKAALTLHTPNGAANLDIEIVRVAPALFVRSRPGLAVATYADGTPVTSQNPAKPDDQITLWLTGLGAVKGSPAENGVAATNLPVLAKIQVDLNGVLIEPSAAVLAASLAGIYQITFRLPSLTGPRADLHVVANGVLSNSAQLPLA